MSGAGGRWSFSLDLAARVALRGLDPPPLKLPSTAAAIDTTATPLPPLLSLSSTGTFVEAGVVFAVGVVVEDPEG